MPINLLGSQYKAPDTFAYMSNPNLQWMSMADFMSATGSTKANYTDYWNAHDTFIAQRLTDLGIQGNKKISWNVSPFNFTIERAENNLYQNKNAWYTLDDIMNNGGNILAFDTETIGDFTAEMTEREARVAGITEIGFATTHQKGLLSGNYSGAHEIADPAGSFFFGIDSEQKKWLEDVLQKKVKGEKLTDTEISAMERASRHSTLGEHGFQTFTSEWNGKQYTFVKQLNMSKPDSIADIRSGIEAMSSKYVSNRDEQISELISYIDQFTKGKPGKHRAIVGQNLPFDTNVMNRYAMMHGFNGLSERFEYADSMFALRAYASASNTTVAEIVKKLNPSVTNERLGSLEALTEAITSSTGYTQSLAHNAYEDSLATLKVFQHIGGELDDPKHFNVVNRAINVLNNIQSTPNTLTLNDSLVRINANSNIRSQDILVMDGQATTGYQITNQYWKFNGVGETDYSGVEWNGKTIVKSQNRYIARFDSVNGDGATLFKAFDNELDFRSWLSKNTSLVQDTAEGIALQTQIHDRDIARRVIDGFFDVGQVSQYYKGNSVVQAGGFASFQKYYSMYQDLASLSEEAVTSMHLSDASGNEIKTASQLLKNINTGDNIAGIIDYADKNGLNSITSNFRTSAASQVDRMTAHQAGIKYYDQRKIMQQVFDMFEDNQEFFAFANQEISSLDDNMTRTIAFNSIKEQYINSSDVTKLATPTLSGIIDENSISIATGKGAYARIDLSDASRGTRQLLRAFNDKTLVDAQVASKLLDVAEDLHARSLITEEGLEIIKATHGASRQPYMVAQSIVTKVQEQVNAIKSLQKQGNATQSLIETLHPGGTLLASATSEMSLVSGTLSNTVKEKAQQTIKYLDGTVLIGSNFDTVKETVNGQKLEIDNFGQIRDTLRSMHYDDESIKQYQSIYFTNGKGRSNISRFNENLGEGQDQVRALFYRSQKEEGSAFAIFTRDRDYAKVMETLSNLDEKASNRTIKDALQGKAAYFEIPYLEVFDVQENDVIRQMSGGVKDAQGNWQGGHGARTVFVKQGDDFYRYDTFSFNMYERDGKITGGIKDQGGNYVTSIRQRAELGYANVSTGDYSKAIAAFNNPNISRMTDEASPQMNGVKVNGHLVKRHAISVKDVDYAYTIALDPGEGSLGLLDLMRELTGKGYDAASGSSVQAENALRGIYKAFGSEYNLVFDKDKLFDEHALKSVYDSEPFKHFYQRYLTSQTGGIGADRNIIQGIIDGTKTYGLQTEEIEAIKALRNDSLLQIMSKAADHNEHISGDLSKALHFLAYDAGLNAVGSESYAHKNMMYLSGHNPGMMNNSGSSGLIRPTYTQRANYRSYNLSGQYFTDAQEMSERLGIKFGDAYTTQEYLDTIAELDRQSLKKVGEAVTPETVSRRNIIGAVQSMSDTEIRAGRDEAIQYMLAHNTENLDVDALKNVYDRMVNDINTYEGKAYVRPSVANQEFFTIGDPKNIKSTQLRNVFEIGTEAEQRETANVLHGLIGQKVENGTVIGRRLNAEGRFRDIVYQGQTIQQFTEKNALELMSTGKTQAIVESQLEGFKIMFDEEKATAETLRYYTSIDPLERAAEVQETMRSVGLGHKIRGEIVDLSKQYSDQELQDIQQHMTQNIRTLNQYTDLANDAITRANQSGFKTIVIGNNNVAKHLSDTAVSSRWNIIARSFEGKEGYEELRKIAAGIKLADNSDFIDHLRFSENETNRLYGAITFDNPSDNGSINTLDALVSRLRENTGERAQKAITTIDMFEKNGIALQSIQRQQMNTFQGQAFKMDQRMYQTLIMQDMENYTKGEGAELAELIRSNIVNGEYDNPRNIAGIGTYGTINRVWADTVRTRRGILSPHLEQRMVAGTLDAMDFINGKFDIDTKNIIKVNAANLLSNIPKGAGIDAYSNFIFMVDGQPTPYIESLAKLGTNTTEMLFGSNSFYLDLSDYGKFNFNGQKGLTGIVLPYQFLNSADDDLFLGESTKETMKFFRTLQGLSGTDNGKQIEEALDDLFKAYGKELSTANKDSLITKSLYKMKMPNSSGALAKDAIVPTVPMTPDAIQHIRNLEYELSRGLETTGSVNRTKLADLSEALRARKQLVKDTQQLLRDEKNDVVSLLNITSGNPKYAQYLRHYDANGNLLGDTIESAVTTSKEMFKATEMDTGFIGHQITQDYFSGDVAGVKRYDSLSRFHREVLKGNKGLGEKIVYEASQFNITNEEFAGIFEDLYTTFEHTNHRDWALRTSQAIDRILNTEYEYVLDANHNKIFVDGIAQTRKLSLFERQARAMKRFEGSLNDYLKNDVWAISTLNSGIDEVATKEYQRQFLAQVNTLFEGIGDRYASEVGILGLTGRYPFFNETGVLPVRIYLDNAVRGKEIRFLGPQFSILQNLDFDGDTEFLKFLGNGGLLAKDAQETVLMNSQFNKMNQYNVNIFANSLSDSVKAYSYGDEALFKASLLKDLDKASYDKAASGFLDALTKEDLELVNLEHNAEMKDLLIAHSKSMSNAFAQFDITTGRSINNPDMVKAAIQARLAKEYIGNYSKPNLEIRNAMTYMMSLADDEQLKTLRSLRESLFTFATDDGKPGGLLTLLEQKGIDTKHVHDAATLNNSSAWRVGVTKLFSNAKGAEKIDRKQITEAMTNLVEGARKVFFSESTQSNAEIANEILSKSFDYFKNISDTGDIALGKQYLSALYTMSQMDNAYAGFKGIFRTSYYGNMQAGIQDLSEDELNALFRGRYTLDVPMFKLLSSERFKHFKTDDLFTTFGRAVREGDIFAYTGDNGPIGIKFEGFQENGDVKKIIAKEYDFRTGKVGNEVDLGSAVTIRELNESIKKYGNGSLLDLTDLNTPERNLNIINVVDGSVEVQRRVAALHTENNLQWFFENTDSADFNRRFIAATSASNVMPGYNGNRNLGTVFSNAIDDADVETFRRRIIDINERLQYGIEHGMISGSKDAKELIRAINKNIAANPRKSVITGDNAAQTIEAYLKDSGIHIDPNKREFLTRDLDAVRLSNQISAEIDTRMSTRNARIEELAAQYYNDITQKGIAEEEAFKSAKEAWQKEITQSSQDLFNTLRKASNPYEEMMYRFNWDTFKNNNFIINLNDVKIGSVEGRVLGAKVGFGQFIGTKVGDLSGIQIEQIRREITEALPNLADNSLEKVAARNTQELLSNLGRVSQFQGHSYVTLNFDNADALMKSYKTVFNPEAGERFAQGVVDDAINQAKEAAANASRAASDTVEKKTLLKDIKGTFKDMSPSTKRHLAIGAGVIGGIAALGLAGHALFNNDSNDNVEVPRAVERTLDAQDVKLKNKSDTHYSSAPTEAQSTQKQQRKVAPPSLPKNRTIYHDAGSGFNFKVSAQSFNKLQAESYQKMMQQGGVNNGQLNISRDNSRITDNWLENKFAQLTE